VGPSLCRIDDSVDAIIPRNPILRKARKKSEETRSGTRKKLQQDPGPVILGLI
jgi:hypothetical protein